MPSITRPSANWPTFSITNYFNGLFSRQQTLTTQHPRPNLLPTSRSGPPPNKATTPTTLCCPTNSNHSYTWFTTAPPTPSDIKPTHSRRKQYKTDDSGGGKAAANGPRGQFGRGPEGRRSGQAQARTRTCAPRGPSRGRVGGRSVVTEAGGDRAGDRATDRSRAVLAAVASP